MSLVQTSERFPWNHCEFCSFLKLFVSGFVGPPIWPGSIPRNAEIGIKGSSGVVLFSARPFDPICRRFPS